MAMLIDLPASQSLRAESSLSWSALAPSLDAAPSRVLFEQLADRWEKQTSVLSSPTRKALHPDYRAIIAMGERVVPLILRRMRRHGGHWFWALSEITGQNPVPATAHGTMSRIRTAWLKWGRIRGYC